MVHDVSFRADAFYDQAAVCRLLRITPKAIGNACRSGQLQFAERAGNRFFRGEWVNDWLSPSEPITDPTKAKRDRSEVARG